MKLSGGNSGPSHVARATSGRDTEVRGSFVPISYPHTTCGRDPLPDKCICSLGMESRGDDGTNLRSGEVGATTDALVLCYQREHCIFCLPEIEAMHRVSPCNFSTWDVITWNPGDPKDVLGWDSGLEESGLFWDGTEEPK